MSLFGDRERFKGAQTRRSRSAVQLAVLLARDGQSTLLIETRDGFTLVTLPLVGALAYSAWNTERLTGQSRTAVFNASQAARASRALVDRIGSIERFAQQIVVLDDPEIVAGYARAHRNFRQLA